jgi:hypothetical protein
MAWQKHLVLFFALMAALPLTRCSRGSNNVTGPPMASPTPFRSPTPIPTVIPATPTPVPSASLEVFATAELNNDGQIVWLPAAIAVTAQGQTRIIYTNSNSTPGYTVFQDLEPNVYFVVTAQDESQPSCLNTFTSGSIILSPGQSSSIRFGLNDICPH